MADLEKLHFKIGLSGTYWAKRPIYNILVNDRLLFTQEINSDSDVVEYVEFDVESTTESNTLKIQLANKSVSDTVENEDKTAILKDMLLNIVSIEIDDIDLGQLPFTLSEYYPDHNNELVKNCVNLGWNGTWTLTWNNPFYIWLLENL